MTSPGARDIGQWDAVASAYASTVGGPRDSFFRRLAPFLSSCLGDLTDQRVLDVGCGHGWLSDLLAQQGATVLGIDGSAALIATARDRYPHLEFRVEDLTQEPDVPAGAFDAAVAHMVLMDLPVVEPCIETVARSLRPGGVFVLSVLHPAFFNQAPSAVDDPEPWVRQVAGYLEPEERWLESFGGHWHYHRPLEQYVSALTSHGLLVSGLSEPRSLPSHTRPESEWTEYERWFSSIPTMLAIAAKKL